jgi:hypothetical protein
MNCLICLNNKPTIYTTCCAAYVCTLCAIDMREDSKCICEGIPVLKLFDQQIDIKLARQQYEDNVKGFRRFVNRTKKCLWVLDTPRDKFIAAQEKNIRLVGDVIERIEKFPYMPDIPSYNFCENDYIYQDPFYNICVLEPELMGFLRMYYPRASYYIDETNRKLTVNYDISYVQNKLVFEHTTFADMDKNEYYTRGVQKYGKITAEDIKANPDRVWYPDCLIYNTNVSLEFLIDQLETVWKEQIKKDSWLITILFRHANMTESIAERIFKLSNMRYSDKDADWASVKFIKKYVKYFPMPSMYKAVTMDVYLREMNTHELKYGITNNPNITVKDVKEHPGMGWIFQSLASNSNFKFSDLMELTGNSITSSLIHSYSFNPAVSWREITNLYKKYKDLPIHESIDINLFA